MGLHNNGAVNHQYLIISKCIASCSNGQPDSLKVPQKLKVVLRSAPIRDGKLYQEDIGVDEARVACNALGYGFGEYNITHLLSLDALMCNVAIHYIYSSEEFADRNMTTTTSTFTVSPFYYNCCLKFEEAEDQGTQTNFSEGEQSRTFHSRTSPTQHSRYTIMM